MKPVRSRRPRKVLIHSDQGSQSRGDSWRRFCKDSLLGAKQELARQLLGQRGRRVLLQQLEEGAGLRSASTPVER